MLYRITTRTITGVDDSIVAFFVAIPYPVPKKSRYRVGHTGKFGRNYTLIDPSDFFSKTIRHTLQALHRDTQR